jgi:catechol 2,3-dioxygenase-like lactoylglutathione lyase family enzyme
MDEILRAGAWKGLGQLVVSQRRPLIVWRNTRRRLVIVANWPNRPFPGDRHMAVRSIGFVGMRTEKLQETARLFRDVIGVPTTRESSDLVGFRLPDGTLFELYGPGDQFHAFFSTGPVVGFKVDDFDATHEAMIAAGVTFIGNLQHADGESWQHFHCPDGTIAEIIGPGKPPREPSET